MTKLTSGYFSFNTLCKISREADFDMTEVARFHANVFDSQVCSEIPAPFFPLFKPHIDSVAKCLQVGLNTINWDSMNIDAFLHKARSVACIVWLLPFQLKLCFIVGLQQDSRRLQNLKSCLVRRQVLYFQVDHAKVAWHCVESERRREKQGGKSNF